MDLRANVFDLWVFVREGGRVRYLMLHTSQEKADTWFGGGRFWQIPGEFYEPGEATVAAVQRCLRGLALTAKSVWTCEYVYTIYNRRFDALQVIPVFGAEVEAARQVPLTWEHSEAGWFTAEECLERINFWGLMDSLQRMRESITERDAPPLEFRLL